MNRNRTDEAYDIRSQGWDPSRDCGVYFSVRYYWETNKETYRHVLHHMQGRTTDEELRDYLAQAITLGQIVLPYHSPARRTAVRDLLLETVRDILPASDRELHERLTCLQAIAEEASLDSWCLRVVERRTGTWHWEITDGQGVTVASSTKAYPGIHEARKAVETVGRCLREVWFG